MDCPFHQHEGGHEVHGGIAFPIETALCTACQAGICQCALACYQPEPDQETPRRRFLPITTEGWASVIGATLGLACLPLLGRELLRHLFNLT